VGYKDDVDLYTYVYNDPTDKTDPTGHWALIDDAIAIGAGAIVGVAAQGVEDLVSGHLSSGKEYAASAAGGAVAGEAALYAAPLAGPAGLAGAAALGSATTDVLKSVATGKSLNVKDTAVNAGLAAATAGVPGLKSAAGALEKQLATKAEKGLIASARNSVAAKAITGKAGEDAGTAAAGGGATGAKDRITNNPNQAAFTCGMQGTVSCGK